MLRRYKREPTFALVPRMNRDEARLCSILSCEKRFHNVTEPGWSPPVSIGESLTRVRRWMHEAGYV
jgi:hypothetical protein